MCYQRYPRYSNAWCPNKSAHLRTDIFQICCAAFEKDIVQKKALFRLTKMCRKALADQKVVGMVLMDLSKAYDCLPHDFLIAKLAAYGFGQHSLLLIHSYLSNRKQRVKVGSDFNEWLGIKSGVRQGSVLGPLFSISLLMICFWLLKSLNFVTLQMTLRLLRVVASCKWCLYIYSGWNCRSRIAVDPEICQMANFLSNELISKSIGDLRSRRKRPDHKSVVSFAEKHYRLDK